MTTGSARDHWSSLQLAEFLSVVTSFTEEAAAHAGAAEQVAVALEAEVVAVVDHDTVVACVGYRPGEVPVTALRDAAAAGDGQVELPGVGRCHVARAVLDDTGTALVAARLDDPFESTEVHLLGAMASVLTLSLRPLRQLAVERGLRVLSQAQAADNERLLQEVASRQLFTERLYAIQRAISGRRPIAEVFDEVVETVSLALRDEVVNLLVVDHRAGTTHLAAATGLPAHLMARERSGAVTAGLAAAALEAVDLVVAEDYRSHPARLEPFVQAGIRSAMAQPVLVDDRVAAVLIVATTTPRCYDPTDRSVIGLLGEQLTVALKDVRTAEAMQQAYGDALHQATHDALTGLPNRALATTRLQEALAQPGRQGQVTVMFVDLDRFKAINDSFGHDAGDRVLVEVAARLRACTGAGDTVARLSGDEFVVVADGLRADRAQQLAGEIVEALARPVVLPDRELVVTASVGVALAGPADTADQVLADADVAMYEAKQRGRGQATVFDRCMRTRVRQHAEVEQGLRRAVAHDELRLHYQPIVDALTGEVRSIEALVRWQRGDELVPPGTFIPVAEESGLIAEIGSWVLDRACADLADLRRQDGHDHLQVNVNLSPRQIAQTDVVTEVRAVLDRHDLPGSALVVELTESALVDRADVVHRTVRGLGDLGVRLAIDDFGTGYSSLLHLKRFPVAQLKVDRRFTAGLGTGGDDDAIVRAITGMAEALGMDVVAEGVETTRQAAALLDLGCAAMQGYLLARPAPLESVRADSLGVVLRGGSGGWAGGLAVAGLG